MTMTDPIADMLTRIRNATRAGHNSTVVPTSSIKVSLLKLMEEENFIYGFSEEKKDGHTVLRVNLRYYENQESVIQGLKRVSKPGLRVYVGKNDIPRYYGGIGVSFLSTPKGVMTGRKARRDGTGGELLFYIW